MSHGLYSQLKPAWWAARQGLAWPDAPRQVQLILSDLCSHDCVWCAYRMSGYTSNELFTVGSPISTFGHNNPIRFMPTERAMKLLEEFQEAGVLAVQYTGGGESTLHKSHEAIYARTLEMGLKAALVSNGDSWGPRLSTEILPRFDWVRVSVDAGNPESYARTRRISPKIWDKVWRHIHELSGSIRAQQTNTKLGIGFVVSPDSWREIPDCAQLAKEAGVNNLRLTAVFSPENEKPYVAIYKDIVELIAETKEQFNSHEFTVYDNFGSRINDLRLGNPDYKTCGYMRYTSFVGADMNNYVCCVYSYNKRGLMTNLGDRSFAKWWKSDERKEFMEKFDARGCERCQFNGINKALNYIRGTTQSGEVEHVEWT